ncbi:NEP-like protein [Mya arenaria]|uniref:NEP-like protein n=1 Tax=Mya arenaria TaxID=6604 RepID=A0ABY7F4J2_MYAAR|nr:NEP-like protein [Mya arenaria]
MAELRFVKLLVILIIFISRLVNFYLVDTNNGELKPLQGGDEDADETKMNGNGKHYMLADGETVITFESSSITNIAACTRGKSYSFFAVSLKTSGLKEFMLNMFLTFFRPDSRAKRPSYVCWGRTALGAYLLVNQMYLCRLPFFLGTRQSGHTVISCLLRTDAMERYSPTLPAVILPDGRATRSSSACCGRTPLEVALLLISFISVGVSIALVIILATRPAQETIREITITETDILSSHYDGTETGNVQNLCLTEDCVKAAARLMESMDATVNPCDDFFEYACGSWNKVNEIPEDKTSHDTFTKLRDNIQLQIKALID